MNRFASCKNLKDLYVAFEEGVLEYNVLTDEELDRLASVFEANLPEKVDMPDRPLTEAGYTLIWNVTVDIVESEYKKERGEGMKKAEEEVAVSTEEKVTASEKAKEFVDKSKDIIVNGSKKIAQKGGEIHKELSKISEMPNDKAEKYISENAVNILNKIKDKACSKIKGLKILIDSKYEQEESKVKFRKEQKTLEELVDVIKKTIGDDEKTLWSKFKDIVKEIAAYVLKLILKTAAIVLKVALTLAVGVIKITAVTIVTAGKTANVINKEVVKPSVKAGKKAWADHKAKKAIFDEIEDELFDEFEDEEKDMNDIKEVIDDEE